MKLYSRKVKNRPMINNSFYHELSLDWYQSNHHPIALLRAENQLRNPWIIETIAKTIPSPCSILDIGCGGGFLTNTLVQQGHNVCGVDLSAQALQVAHLADPTKRVHYLYGTAESLPFAAESFDVVCAMDLLEHVENPVAVIQEASRVLKKGGLFFFHTFNRNFLSYLLIIKGVEWCFSNPPRNLHVYSLFIKPKELTSLCEKAQLSVEEIKGMRPSFSKREFWSFLFTKKVTRGFSFVFTPSLTTGYVGYARKI